MNARESRSDYKMDRLMRGKRFGINALILGAADGTFVKLSREPKKHGFVQRVCPPQFNKEKLF
jgi:hypothetical protein